MDLTMPVRCPKGHISTDPDYCSECGAKMPATPSGLDTTGASLASSRSSAQSVLAAAQSGSTQVCPDCGTPRSTPTATFCEVCRYNFTTQTSWATPKVTNPPASASPPPPDVPLAVPTSSPGTGDGGRGAFSPGLQAPAASSPPAVFSTAANAVFPAAEASHALLPADRDGASGVPTPPAAPALPSVTSPSQRLLPDILFASPEGLTLAPIARWEARLTVDPSLNVDPDPDLPCPVGEPERVFPLDFPDNLIGRRSEKRGIFPEINVNDPCASHRHAKLQRQADGSFALLDVGSTNGTQVNGTDVQPNVLTPLQEGDQITLGCWTRITLRGLRS